VAAEPSADPDKFQEAIRAHRRKVPITDPAFRALTEAERERAFWVAGVTQGEAVQEIFDAIDRAIEHGTTLEKFKEDVGQRLVEAWGGEDAARTETIFRTNTMSSYNAGRYEVFSDPAVKAARPYLRFDAVGDSRTSDICEALDGKVLPADDPFWRTHSPPLHHQCFPGETPVLCPDGWRAIQTLGPGSDVIAHDGRPRRVLRRLARSFSGVLVAVRGPSGQIAYPTPNHPLGTKRGWVAAERLNVERDRLWVLQDATPVPDYAIAGGDCGILHPAVVRGLDRGAVPLAPVQLDHQHQRGHSDVNVVSVDRHRDPVSDPHRMQRGRYGGLIGAARDALSSGGATLEFIVAALASAYRLVGSGGLSLPGSAVHAGVAAGVVFGDRPRPHLGVSKHAQDRLAAAPVALADGDRGVSVEIEVDDFLLRQGQGGTWHAISDKRIDSWGRNFRGEVFNLEVEGSPTYIAGGFLVHNCRSVLTPLDPDEAREEGVTRGAPDTGGATPDDGFGRPPTQERATPDLEGFDPEIAAILRDRLK